MRKKMVGLLMAVLLCVNSAFTFAESATAKTSADFADLKDLDAATKAKFDAMISAGIFDGVSDTTFGLKDEMNRAQFAKVAALLLDLKADATTSSFSDVKADDKANGYALPYIEALKSAGITDGYGEGTYNPAGKVTKEQLATFLVRILGKDEDGRAKTGTDTTVSDWAQGYVALALELKLLDNGADGKFGGQTNATRDLLVTGAYESKQQYVEIVEQKKKEEEEEKKKEEEKNKEPIYYTPPVQQILATPIADPASGVVLSDTQVSLSATGGATIYYTTDGSTPTRTNGLVYSVPIVVNSAMTVKAVAIQNGMRDSNVMEASYTILVTKSALDLINEASASGDWTGISETTFADAGITGVTYEYLNGIQGILQDYDYPSAALPKTSAQIQSIVTETINLTLINNYFAYGNGTEPGRETFERAGLNGVTDLNIADIVAYLQSQYGGGPGGGFPGGDPGGGDPGGGFPGGDPGGGDPGGGDPGGGGPGGGGPGGGFPGGGSGGSLYSGSTKEEIQNAINDYLSSH